MGGQSITNSGHPSRPPSLINVPINFRAPCARYITDAQGRRVRAKHVATVTQDGAQLVLWADMRTAPHKHMSLAFQQRRHQIVGDCRQLKMDVDSYNDNRLPVQPIQMIFDFTFDLEELALAA